MKITVVGLGYVGISLSVLLSDKNEVIAFDIDKNKVNMINDRISPINDELVIKYLKERTLNLKATQNYKEAFNHASYIVICVPTNYSEKDNCFDTSIVESVIKDVIDVNKKATIIIKSTVPIGFTNNMKVKYNKNNIIFSPEFLREGKALYDNLYPSRIIVGDKSEKGRGFANLLKDISLKDDVQILCMNNTEAEAVKLFSNAYLAFRVTFFNELDTFAEFNNLEINDIINGVCADNRIGNYYNNPSFGYGGYCLPKDTKQLLAEYKNIPSNLIKSIVESNKIREEYIARKIIEKNANVIGVYRLTMKKDSDNYRNSAINYIIEYLKKEGKRLLIYEPTLKSCKYNECDVENDFDKFVSDSDIIVSNRIDNKLQRYKSKVYTRDLFNRD